MQTPVSMRFIDACGFRVNDLPDDYEYLSHGQFQRNDFEI
jgi:hypothetical protein